MNFGEKFPYALLTFSQKFVEAGYWVHLLQSLSKLVIGHTFSQKLSKLVIGVHYTPIITRTPSSISTPYPTPTPTIHQLYTHHTPTIHNPTTPPIPLLLRVDSDEMRQKPAGFYLMRCWNARERPRSGRPRSGLRACAGANEGG